MKPRLESSHKQCRDMPRSSVSGQRSLVKIPVRSQQPYKSRICRTGCYEPHHHYLSPCGNAFLQKPQQPGP